MDELIGWMRGLPTAGLVAVLLIVVIQLSLQVYSLIDLARRRAVLYEHKWIWFLVIVLGNLLGAILYLALGRRVDTPHAASEPTADSTPGKEKAERTIDLLYGNGNDS